VSTESRFLNTCAAKLDQSADRIGVCLGKLSEDQVWARGHENENAVGNLILHLCGNVRQWVMHGLGGHPDVRTRDAEFSAAGGSAPSELAAKVRQTIDEARSVIAALRPDQLTAVYTIQNRTVSGVEAVLNVVEHFAQHTGQIIFATKNLTGLDLGLAMPRKR
jgi:uncharacterized damage-inducible protein DinB